ncbi:MAG: F0F1 ATP synthase subunit epsilon [Thermodesulfobacteriota bacterium]
MRLKIMTPTQIVVNQETAKVIAEAENGSFCLLPRHIDFVAALVPGILSFFDSEGTEEFAAVDEGILIKAGREVLVSIRNAVRSKELGTLRQTVAQEFQVKDERERTALAAGARLEADIVRKFIELGERERI